MSVDLLSKHLKSLKSAKEMTTMEDFARRVVWETFLAIVVLRGDGNLPD